MKAWRKSSEDYSLSNRGNRLETLRACDLRRLLYRASQLFNYCLLPLNNPDFTFAVEKPAGTGNYESLRSLVVA